MLKTSGEVSWAQLHISCTVMKQALQLFKWPVSSCLAELHYEREDDYATACSCEHHNNSSQFVFCLYMPVCCVWLTSFTDSVAAGFYSNTTSDRRKLWLSQTSDSVTTSGLWAVLLYCWNLIQNKTRGLFNNPFHGSTGSAWEYTANTAAHFSLTVILYFDIKKFWGVTLEIFPVSFLFINIIIIYI